MVASFAVQPAAASANETETGLENLGFSPNEAALLNELLWRSPQTSAELQKNTNTPKATVYRVLKQMTESGLVAVIPGMPICYQAPAPEILFSRLENEAEERLARIAEARKSAGMTYPAPSVPRKAGNSAMQFLHGRRQAYALFCAVMEKTVSEWLFVGLQPASASWCVAAGLLDTHRNTPNVRKRVIYLDSPGNRAMVAATPPLGTTQFRFVPLSAPTRFAVVDGKFLFQVSQPGSSNKFHDDSEVAIATDSPGLVSAHRLLFEALWEFAQP